ncbi:hypothetical protein ARMGADRAFT_1005881 [Armillaria gallica]|uniref:Zinc-finger domain-containing protein n=1 Tax=Armillaria gallica TaxID=47427 RepID=A0A2H3ESC4_ARMGA|nr:hypothetical protein ARMGADRAFT_1005881 [Armillaria gallica]
MCYAYGSLDQAISTCPMCKVFPHPSRCPHVREVCRNRASHPRFDVYFLKNAEVDSFNGCGYCKWARTNPPQKAAGYLNPGWPGCCRPPAPSEHRMIQAADWRSVSIVHHIPIPPDIKATLDGLRPGGSPAAPPRGPPKPPAPDRKGSPPSKTAAMPPKSPAISIPPKSRGSPKQGTASLSGSLSRSTPPADKPATPPSSGATTPRRNSSATRPPIPASLKSPNRSPPNQPLERRRTLVPSPTSKPPSLSRPDPSPPPPRPKKDEDTASNASGSSGSMSDSTVTSDGGFTDYLSDESEAELQRQAEARAALVAQNQAEELEFKAARLQLTHVDLRPPRSWDATNPVGSSPRLASRSTVSVATSGGSNRS